MKLRRPARARHKDDLYRAIQHSRLEQIAGGKMEPLYPREHYFLWTLKARGRADYSDFVIPGLLFLAETELHKLESEPQPEPAATAS